MYSEDLHKEYLDKLKTRVASMKELTSVIGQRIPIRNIVKNPKNMKSKFIQISVKQLFPFIKLSLDDGREFLKDKINVEPKTNV